jgi:hypothetical protein
MKLETELSSNRAENDPFYEGLERDTSERFPKCSPRSEEPLSSFFAFQQSKKIILTPSSNTKITTEPVTIPIIAPELSPEDSGEMGLSVREPTEIISVAGLPNDSVAVGELLGGNCSELKM